MYTEASRRALEGLRDLLRGANTTLARYALQEAWGLFARDHEDQP